jgi:hypothetical protein
MAGPKVYLQNEFRDVCLQAKCGDSAWKFAFYIVRYSGHEIIGGLDVQDCVDIFTAQLQDGKCDGKPKMGAVTALGEF